MDMEVLVGAKNPVRVESEPTVSFMVLPCVV